MAIFGAVVFGFHEAFEGIGKLGNSLGPGYGDLLQGATGLGLLLAGPRLARKAESGATKNERASNEYGVAFFGDINLGYYTQTSATIGRTGKPFFFMPLEDSAVVKSAGDAARYTGRAPSAEAAYLNGGDVYGLSFPVNGMKVSTPTVADAGGWPHFLEGGHTAVRLGDGPSAGYLVNPTREYIIPGGSPAPSGSMLFKLGPNGEWLPIRKF